MSGKLSNLSTRASTQEKNVYVELEIKVTRQTPHYLVLRHYKHHIDMQITCGHLKMAWCPAVETIRAHFCGKQLCASKPCIPPTIPGKFFNYLKLFILTRAMANDSNCSLLEIIAKYGILIRE